MGCRDRRRLAAATRIVAALATATAVWSVSACGVDPEAGPTSPPTSPSADTGGEGSGTPVTEDEYRAGLADMLDVLGVGPGADGGEARGRYLTCLVDQTFTHMSEAGRSVIVAGNPMAQLDGPDRQVLVDGVARCAEEVAEP